MESKIIEGNKLIAEFMGILLDPLSNTKTSIHFGSKTLQYHTSWDWLMPVVEKIAKIEIKDCVVIHNGEDSFFDSYYMRTFGMISSENKDYMVRINRCRLHYSKSLIEATYNAVIEFLTWYKNQPS